MQAPDTFVERLARDYDGRLRIRWSEKRSEWQIEQRVGRASLPPFRIDPYDDSHIRARDGFLFVCAIRPGTRMPCPTCGLTLKVPVFEFGEAICGYCKLQGGRKYRFRACYFPLSDMLLEHLRKIDPQNDGLRRIRDEANADAAAKERSKDRKLGNEIEDVIKDNLNSLFDVAHVGYTGKETSWER